MAELLKAKEVAEILKLCPVVVRRMIAKGEIPSVTIGKRRRVLKDQLEKYIRGEK